MEAKLIMSRYFLVVEPQQEAQRTGKVSFFPLVQVLEVAAKQIDPDPKLNSSPRAYALKELESIAMSIKLLGQIDGKLKPTLNRYALRIEIDGLATDLNTGEKFSLPIDKLMATIRKMSRVGSIMKSPRPSVYTRGRGSITQISKSKTSVKLPIIEKSLNRTLVTKHLTTPLSARLPVPTEEKSKFVRRTRVLLTAIERNHKSCSN